MPCYRHSVGVIIRRDGSGLLIDRARGTPGWAFPAGHREPDEGDRDAAVREVLEEVGIRISPDQFSEPILSGWFRDPCRHGATEHHWTVYEAQVGDDIEPDCNPAEVRDARWVPLTEWSALDLEPVWRNMLTKTGHINA